MAKTVLVVEALMVLVETETDTETRAVEVDPSTEADSCIEWSDMECGASSEEDGVTAVTMEEADGAGAWSLLDAESLAVAVLVCVTMTPLEVWV